MKVTALIPDDVVRKVRSFSGGKNVTESLVIALTDWIALKKITALNRQVEDNPLRFKGGFSAEKIRSLNRKTA